MGKIQRFKSTHKLAFKTAAQRGFKDYTGLEKFEVGTCHGLWQNAGQSVDIHSVINSTPGNGHMDDVFEWFTEMARLRKVPLRVVGITNRDFRDELVGKAGFMQTDDPAMIIKYDFL